MTVSNETPVVENGSEQQTEGQMEFDFWSTDLSECNENYSSMTKEGRKASASSLHVSGD